MLWVLVAVAGAAAGAPPDEAVAPVTVLCLGDFRTEGYGLESVSEPVWARYGPPFMPWFLRRNEVPIEVREPVSAT